MDATNKEDIRRLEARLERENNYTTLDNHWSAIKNVHINQPLSDHHYKYHISKLMSTYTRPSGKVDNHKQPISRKVKAVTQLYGVNGIRYSSPAKVVRRREAGWEGRVDIYEKVDSLSKKKFACYDNKLQATDHSKFRSNKEEGNKNIKQSFSCRQQSPDRLQGTKSADSPNQPHTHPKSSSRTRHSHQETKKQSRRADFDGISENDLIANGLYTLTPKQLSSFNAFTDMISSFDNTDMVHLLEDALEEARSKTGLEDYDGFAELPVHPENE